MEINVSVKSGKLTNFGPNQCQLQNHRFTNKSLVCNPVSSVSCILRTLSSVLRLPGSVSGPVEPVPRIYRPRFSGDDRVCDAMRQPSWMESVSRNSGWPCRSGRPCCSGRHCCAGQCCICKSLIQGVCFSKILVDVPWQEICPIPNKCSALEYNDYAFAFWAAHRISRGILGG